VIAGRVRRCCAWHLVDLTEGPDGELVCLAHAPKAWLVVDGADRIVAAGSAGEPISLLVHPPMPLDTYIAGPWLALRSPERTFGVGARLARVPAAVRRALASKRKTRDSLDALRRLAGPCHP
jgi:hypothetical protein